MSQLVSSKRKGDLDKIRDFYFEGKPLTPRAEEKLTRMRFANTSMLSGNSRQQTVDMICEEYKVGDSQAYEIVRDTMLVFGEIAEADKRGMRHIITERYERLYQKAEKEENLEVQEKILGQLAKLHGLHEGDIFDITQINLPRNIIFSNDANILIADAG